MLCSLIKRFASKRAFTAKMAKKATVSAVPKAIAKVANTPIHHSPNKLVATNTKTAPEQGRKPIEKTKLRFCNRLPPLSCSGVTWCALPQ